MHRLALIALALCTAAVGLGFILARGGSGSALADGPPGVLARGSFKTVSWGTTGSATLERRSGRVLLRLSGDFRTQRAPELFVHMGKRRMPLRRAWGPQVYVLRGADAATLGATVQIFCEKCNKAWGEAKLVPTRAA